MEEDTFGYVHLNYLISDIGHSTLKVFLIKTATECGFHSFEEFLDDTFVKQTLYYLRTPRNVRRLHNGTFRGLLTERAWHLLYRSTENCNGNEQCVNFTVEPNVLSGIDYQTAYIILKYVVSEGQMLLPEVIQCIQQLSFTRELLVKTENLHDIVFKQMLPETKTAVLTMAHHAGNSSEVSSKIAELDRMGTEDILDPLTKNFMQLQKLLHNSVQRIMRSTISVSLSNAGFKTQEELFNNRFIQSELIRKTRIRNSRRATTSHREKLVGPVYKPYSRASGRHEVTSHVKQSLRSLEFGFMYILLKDISTLHFEVSPYSPNGAFSFIKTLRNVFAKLQRRYPNNKIEQGDFECMWQSCIDAMKVLMRFCGISSMHEKEILEPTNIQTFLEPQRQVPRAATQMFRIWFEFPPMYLANYEFSRSKIADLLQKHQQAIGMFNIKNYDLVLLHTDKHSAKMMCAEFFDSEPVVEKLDDNILNTEDDIRNPILCIVHPHIHQITNFRHHLGVLPLMKLSEVTSMTLEEDSFQIFLDLTFCTEFGKRPLYNELYKVVVEKAKRLQKHISDTSLHEDLQSYIDLCCVKIPRKKLLVSDDCKRWLNSNMPQKIRCYSISDKLKIYVKPSEQKEILNTILAQRFVAKSDLELVEMNKTLQFIPLYLPGHKLYLGEDLHNIHGGSIALYGKRKSNNSTVAISHGHVIQQDDQAFVTLDNARQTLGSTIYPPKDSLSTHINELAVVEVTNERVKELLEAAKIQQRKIEIFTGNMIDLQNVKIMKVGATTNKTKGFVADTDFYGPLGDGENVCRGIVIKPEHDDGTFAYHGDSGALTFIPKPKEIIAISLIYSNMGPENERLSHVLTTVLRDCKSSFEKKRDDEIILDGDHGLSRISDNSNS